jgi:NDP-sugar pyrophosphorylase family protein
VVDVALLNDLVKEEELPLRAVVMAGGYGTRLRPITEELPKPMLPIGDRPLLELTLQQLRDAGIKRVNLATHYKRDIIANHFGDGHNFGVKIRYVEEDQPLGTAGALGLIETSEDPLLVINGDVVTRVDFHAMLDFHRHHRADMTVAVRQHEVQLPHGVVETDGLAITGISEKPILRHFMNAGIYLLNPEMCRFVPSGRRYDMTDLISRLIAEGCRVVSFPIREYWLDIGQVEDYQKALRDFESKTP